MSTLGLAIDLESRCGVCTETIERETPIIACTAPSLLRVLLGSLL